MSPFQQPVRPVLLTLENSIHQTSAAGTLHNMNTLLSSLLYLNKRNKVLVLSTIVLCLLSFQSFAQEEYTVYYFDNGKVSSEGYMLDGKPNNYWITYHPNGKKKTEGNRRNFQLDSIWVFYNEDGLKTNEIRYREGKKHGLQSTYQSGVLYEQNTYENDVRVNEYVQFYATGEVQRRLPIQDGKEHGDGFEYDLDGRVITLLSYREGNLRSAEKVNRYDNSGKKRGPWIEYHNNGVLASEGFYMNDRKHGIFKTYDRKGDLISLEKFKEGSLEVGSEESVILDLRNTYYEDGRLKSTGGYVDGLKEGTHRLYGRDGGIVGGELYSKGQKVGEGIIDQNGDYQGLWKLYYSTGELQAEGEFENTKRINDWTYYHRNGKIEHKAKFVNGLPHGKWTWYYETGQLRREEFFRRGKEDGNVIEYDEQGNTIVNGNYVNGLREGEWFLNVGDHTERGSYLDGERTGVWVYEYENEEVAYTGEYVGGLATGKHSWYYPNGKLMMEGKYSSGVRTGTWKKYDEEGIEMLNVRYKSGREVKINGKAVPKSDTFSL